MMKAISYGVAEESESWPAASNGGLGVSNQAKWLANENV